MVAAAEPWSQTGRYTPVRDIEEPHHSLGNEHEQRIPTSAESVPVGSPNLLDRAIAVKLPELESSMFATVRVDRWTEADVKNRTR
jgi:hypothetical protein